MDTEERVILVDRLTKRLRAALAKYDDDVRLDVLWKLTADDEEMFRRRLTETMPRPDSNKGNRN